MQDYKKIIFKKAIQIRLNTGDGTLQEILDSYPKLTTFERSELEQEFLEYKK